MQGLAEPGSRELGEGKRNGSLLGDWSSFCVFLVSFLLVSTWIHIGREHRHSSQRPSCPAVHLPSRGRARWVGDGVGDCHDAADLSRECLFYFSLVSFWVRKLCSFLRDMVLCCWILLDMLVAKRDPTPCYHDAYSVGTPKWAFWGATLSPLFRRVFSGKQNSFPFWGAGGVDAPYREG